MDTLVDSHLALNDAQQKSINNLTEMSIVFNQAKESLGDQFAASFSKGLEDLGINAQNLSSEMGSLVPLVRDLGTGTAQTVKGFKDLLDVLSIITDWKINFSELINQRNRIFSSKGLHLLGNHCCHRASSIWQLKLKIL